MPDVVLTFTENGPTELVGDVILKDHDGRVVSAAPGEPIYLCRCGMSNNKPFCDGSHTGAGFDGTLAA
jgi:CDGSH-type Zn-finger protein